MRKKLESLNVTQFEKLKGTIETKYLSRSQRRGLGMIRTRVTLQTEKFADLSERQIIFLDNRFEEFLGWSIEILFRERIFLLSVVSSGVWIKLSSINL